MQTLIASPRPGFLTVTELQGWKFKTYGIATAARPRTALVQAAHRLAVQALPDRPDLAGAYGVGFLIVHDTDGCCLALIDWWVRPDELCQRVFVAPPDEPYSLAPQPTATIGRIPELTIIAHERQAWLRHVLDRPSGPDLDGYLADTLH
jgi:hypothetical protein